MKEHEAPTGGALVAQGQHPNISVSPATFDALASAARRNGRSLEHEAEATILRGLAADPSVAPVSGDPKRCLFSACKGWTLSRGLCPKHYGRVKYYLRSGHLSESWLVAHGRMQGRQGFVPQEDSIENLPRVPRQGLRDPEMQWLFDWPATEKARRELEGREKK